MRYLLGFLLFRNVYIKKKKTIFIKIHNIEQTFDRKSFWMSSLHMYSFLKYSR